MPAPARTSATTAASRPVGATISTRSASEVSVISTRSPFGSLMPIVQQRGSGKHTAKVCKRLPDHNALASHPEFAQRTFQRGAAVLEYRQRTAHFASILVIAIKDNGIGEVTYIQRAIDARLKYIRLIYEKKRRDV